MPPMFRALLPLFFVFLPALAWAQTAPPADTKAARERHRIEEKQAPPPEGAWGPEEFGLTWHNPVWRGLFVSAGTYAGGSLELNVPRGIAVQSDGINPPIIEHLDYHQRSIQARSIGLAADFDTFRLSAEWFDGTFDARATLHYEDGFTPVSPLDVSLHGSLYGFRVGAYWPALRYRNSSRESLLGMEATLGLAATVGWMHEEVAHVPGALLLTRDTVDMITGSIGPKATLRAMV